MLGSSSLLLISLVYTCQINYSLLLLLVEILFVHSIFACNIYIYICMHGCVCGDRGVAGCAHERLRERLLLAHDDLTFAHALKIAQPFEWATTESSTHARWNPSASVQALRAKKAFKTRGRSPSSGSPIINTSQERGRCPPKKSSPTNLATEIEQTQEAEHDTDVPIHSPAVTSALQQESNAKVR